MPNIPDQDDAAGERVQTLPIETAELATFLVQLITATYTSVSVARLKAEVFSAAYTAHVRNGSLPEEARSIARSTAEYMYGLVGSKE